ncbi:MAG: hypothetical protein Q8N47_04045 [Bryobacterales bacterium]|nr:hypothetical protein [Bryobacterales bacterium]
MAARSIEEQLRYLYARKSVVEELIRSLEAYWHCVASVPRKAPASETADFIFRRLAL